MVKGCEGDTMPLQCVERFEAGALKMAEAAAKIEAVGGRLEALADKVHETHTILVGNGDPQKGVTMRVAAMESHCRHVTAERRALRKWLMGILAAIIVGLIVALLTGCNGSDSRTLARSLVEARQSLDAMRSNVQKARQTVDTVGAAPDVPESQKVALRQASDLLTAADTEGAAVITAIGTAQEASAGMQDVPNPDFWDVLMKYAPILATVVIAIVLYKLGVFAMVKPLVGAVGRWIAKRHERREEMTAASARRDKQG